MQWLTSLVLYPPAPAPAAEMLTFNSMGDKIKGGLGSALSSINAIKSMVGGLGGLLDFPPPLVAKNRGKEWMQDSEWGRQVMHRSTVHGI